MWITKKYKGVTLWEWLFLILAIVILISYIWCQMSAPNIEKYLAHKNIKKMTTEELIKQTKNGDIILLAGNTSGEKTCRRFANSIFSHVGILFRENHPKTNEDIVYILDCDLGQGYKDGVRIMTLLDKLERYKGFRIGAIKKLVVSPDHLYPKQKRPTTDEILDLVPKYIKLDFDAYIFGKWVFAEWKTIHQKIKNPDTMFCSEFVTSVFQDLGIIKKDKVPSWYHPGDFDKARLNMEKGFSFGETTFFEFPEK